MIKPLIVSSLLLFATQFASASDKVVKVGTLGDQPPYCMTKGKFKSKQSIPPGKDAKGFIGYSWDVLRESYHAMGYTIDLTITPWTRAMFNVKKNKVDILFPTGKNKEREKIFHYSKSPINEVQFLVYTKKNRHLPWTDLTSLKGLKIGVNRGFNYGDRWHQTTGINKIEINTIVQGFTMLDSNRLDGFLGYESSWDYILKENGWVNKYDKLPPFDGTQEFLVTSRTNKVGTRFIDIYDQGKKIIEDNGLLKKIDEKWFGGS